MSYKKYAEGLGVGTEDQVRRVVESVTEAFKEHLSATLTGMTPGEDGWQTLEFDINYTPEGEDESNVWAEARSMIVEHLNRMVLIEAREEGYDVLVRKDPVQSTIQPSDHLRKLMDDANAE